MICLLFLGAKLKLKETVYLKLWVLDLRFVVTVDTYLYTLAIVLFLFIYFILLFFTVRISVFDSVTLVFCFVVKPFVVSALDYKSLYFDVSCTVRNSLLCVLITTGCCCCTSNSWPHLQMSLIVISHSSLFVSAYIKPVYCISFVCYYTQKFLTIRMHSFIFLCRHQHSPTQEIIHFLR